MTSQDLAIYAALLQNGEVTYAAATDEQGLYVLAGYELELGYLPAGAATVADNLSAGSYAIAGKTVTDSAVRADALSAGAYVLAGKSITDLVARNDALAKGAYVVAGQGAADTVVHADALAAGAYSISGKTATDSKAASDTLATGAYALSGKAVTDSRVVSDALAAGAYAYAGKDITDAVHPAGGVNVADDLSAGTYLLAGQDITDVKVTSAPPTSDMSGASGGGGMSWKDSDRRYDKRYEKPKVRRNTSGYTISDEDRAEALRIREQNAAIIATLEMLVAEGEIT